MSWVPVYAWIAVGVIAVVVLGFAGFEVAWKARRLRRDIDVLTDIGARARQLQADAIATQQRLARVHADGDSG